MTLIRAAFALFALTVCVVMDARSAATEIYRPWCVVYTGRGGRSCAFTSFEQCMMRVAPALAARACKIRGTCGTESMAKAELATSAAGPVGGNEAHGNQPLSKVARSGARPLPGNRRPVPSKRAARSALTALRTRNIER